MWHWNYKYCQIIYSIDILLIKKSSVIKHVRVSNEWSNTIQVQFIQGYS